MPTRLACLQTIRSRLALRNLSVRRSTGTSSRSRTVPTTSGGRANYSEAGFRHCRLTILGCAAYCSWLKVSLDARGKLADGYPAIGTGFDQLVIDGLNLKRDAVVSFISEKRPTYTQFEQWVREQPGATLETASIDKLNKAIAGYNHDDETRHSVLGAANLADDNKAPHDAVNLNNLDDWTEFHQAELK